ncbi:MAG: ribosome-associated translation inhibitor RaiA [Bacteroidetes bacterium]|nr:ribosome-associated translation inhibitor RaiA [Bacteroidota bacterium]
MDIIIQSPGFKASESLESYVKEKLNKLDEHDSKIIRADVTLYLGPQSEPANNYCEIRLEVPGADHFVKKNSTTFEHSVVESVEALHRMIQKDKDRNIDRRRTENTTAE